MNAQRSLQRETFNSINQRAQRILHGWFLHLRIQPEGDRKNLDSNGMKASTKNKTAVQTGIDRYVAIKRKLSPLKNTSNAKRETPIVLLKKLKPH